MQICYFDFTTKESTVLYFEDNLYNTINSVWQGNDYLGLSVRDKDNMVYYTVFSREENKFIYTTEKHKAGVPGFNYVYRPLNILNIDGEYMYCGSKSSNYNNDYDTLIKINLVTGAEDKLYTNLKIYQLLRL